MRERDTKWTRGYQYQYCVKTARPTTEAAFWKPPRELQRERGEKREGVCGECLHMRRA